MKVKYLNLICLLLINCSFILSVCEQTVNKVGKIESAATDYKTDAGCIKLIGSSKKFCFLIITVLICMTHLASHCSMRLPGYSVMIIRIERPEKLAAFLLKDDNKWISNSISSAMHSGKERNVLIVEKVPVYRVFNRICRPQQ